MSTVFGAISLASMIAVVYLSYQSGGNAHNGYGLTGVLSTIFSFIGLALGIISIRDKTCFKFFPVLGIIINLLVLGGVSLILYLGSIL